MFLQQLINALTIGSLYALTAMGATLIYGILGILDIANAGAYLIGAYIGYYIYSSTGHIVLAFLVAMACAGILGILLQRLIYSPILARPHTLSIIPLVAAVGLFTMSSDAIRLICGPNSMPGEWLSKLNAEDVGEKLGITAFMAEVTVEEFLNVDPAIIFCESPMAKEMYAEEQYAGLSAVQNEKLLVVPYGLACSGLATSDNPLVWYFAANNLHPDTCTFDLDAITADFYQTFYNYTLSQEQIDAILQK